MYQMSQSYASTPQFVQFSNYTSRSSSPLEYIAHSAVSYSSPFENSPLYFNMSSTPKSPLYTSFSSHLFSSVSSSLSSPTNSNYSYSPKHHAYSKNQTQYHHPKIHQEYHFKPDNFLKPGKHSIFVGNAEQIRPYVEETFSLLFNTPLPENIKISICNETEFRKIAPHHSTIGLSINRGELGLLSEIFVLNDTLPRVLLTLGHELGHVLTKTLSNAHNEEAKAYAFSITWMNIIKQHNIANLADCIITESPAHNGLHNIAFNFVTSLLKTGKDAWHIYRELINQKITITETSFLSTI